MNLPSTILEQAVEQLATLPGVGKRSALRHALFLMKEDELKVRDFAEAVLRLKTHLLKSLDYRSSQPNGIVASGYLQSSTLHLYTLTSTAWGNCTNSNSAPFNINAGYCTKTEKEFSRSFCDVSLQIMVCNRLTTPKVIICQ